MLIQNKKLLLSIFGVLVLFNILAFSVLMYLQNENILEVIFFNVGQGDSIFIETPQKHQILIDGGPDVKVLEKIGNEMPFYDRTIDLIVLTHPEKDHLAGILEVFKSYQVENILWSGVIRDNAEFKEWNDLLYDEGAQIKIARAGEKIKWDDNPNHYIEVLYPLESLEGREVKESNDSSIVLKLVFKNKSFLFVGDIYDEIEKKLIKDKISLDSDVLKLSHHGSKTSNSEEFLLAVSPEIGVISVGKDNKYGHPHREILERLEKYGIKILRTDLDGDIKFSVSDNELKILK